MNRTLINIVIDLIAAFLFLGMLATGYLLRFPLPPGSNKTHVLWGLTRHEWGDIHFWISLGLLLIMLLHLALHWNWIVTVIGKRCGLVKDKQPSLLRCGVWTLVGLAVICGAFAWIVEQNVQTLDSPRRVHGVGGRWQDNANLQSVPEPAAESQNEAPVWQDVLPIFQKHCLSCHGPQRQLAGFRADNRQDFFKSDQALVIPGQLEQSPLLAIVGGRRPEMAMADVHRLPEVEVLRIKAWIANGAQ